MIGIIRDPIWQFVAVILAIIVIIIMIFYNRQKKAISWQIISNTPLLKINEVIKRSLEVRFNGEPVKDIQLIIAKIINTGNVPIKSTDYEGSINLNFGKDAQILTAEVIETSPNNLKASANIEGKKVIIPPTLMNGKDWITLKILVSQFDETITVDGRIVGVKEIKEYTDLSQNKLIAYAIPFIIGVLTLFIVKTISEFLEILFGILL